ncbi:unnamed protein product [Diabrotica balteata]|uniref:Uncharacterized protein n=1 Tax=Diabrotica balteata TaxID=107213 RepID=A0A9N9XE26_DIABA|nr:unnamed protein product [Diabrotica balteata]
MDMEKLLLTPQLEVGQLYYKRKLKTYNFTVYNLKTTVAINYMWHKLNGTKGSSEVVTCLWNMLSELPSEVSEVTFYYDTATVPKKPHILDIKEVSPKSRRKIELRNRILICTVRGFPLPKITWRRKNQELHHSRAYNVLYKRRQSKLVIKKPDAEYLGQYECVAETVNGLKASKNFTLLPQPNKKCSENFDKDFCQNGGTCFHEASMNYYGCFCPDNYSGEKCEVKKPSNTSMYPQPDLYACNLGLSTKYNC